MQYHADFSIILHSQRTVQGPNRKMLTRTKVSGRISASARRTHGFCRFPLPDTSPYQRDAGAFPVYRQPCRR